MSADGFIGRKHEITILNQLTSNNIANLVVIQGRRRVGKSRMVEEFARGAKLYEFIGLAPSEHVTAQIQRDEFMRKMREYFQLPLLRLEDWGDIFTLFAKEVVQGKCIILFDEISWMAEGDAAFLAKLKNAWDSQFKKNNKLLLILCGSVSAWIQKNIISSTIFLGRHSTYMQLQELPLKDSIQLLGDQASRISVFEKLKLLSITGGIPRYLELIDLAQSAEENIHRLCFESTSPLRHEFKLIFNDIFGMRGELYKKIILVLINGRQTLENIALQLGIEKSGDLSDYLTELELAGFVSKDFTWNIKTEKNSNLLTYRLKDNFTRFYLKFVEPHITQIEKGFYDGGSIATILNWESILGLQFENSVLNNVKPVIKKLNIPMEDILFAGPFFQRATKKNKGCQIDLLIQTKFNGLIVCEIKFSREKIGKDILSEMQDKLVRLVTPKNYSVRSVLIHVNGISDSVRESRFFANIIDFAELLE